MKKEENFDQDVYGFKASYRCVEDEENIAYKYDDRIS